MSKRRMFSTDVVDTDSFLDMPSSSRCLYYDLGMRADDDGFVSPKKVIRLTGASDDDLKILITKKFIIPFSSGVIVIKDWKMNNYIQKDRYTETIYKDEKKSIIEDENRSYSLVDTTCIQNVSKMDTQVSIGKYSIGEVSIGEDSIKNTKVFGLSASSEIKEKPKKEKYGSEHVNNIIKYFTELKGHAPADRYPRNVAHNLVQRIQTIIKNNNLEATDQRIEKWIKLFFVWIRDESGIADGVQKLETVKLKTVIWEPIITEYVRYNSIKREA